MLEIKISADKMIGVLIDSGLSEIDAKAIVLDLLLEAERPGKPSEIRNSLNSAVRERRIRRNRPEQRPLRKEKIEEPEPESEEEYIEEEPAPRRRISRKRVNFSDFGGDSIPLKG